MLSQKVSISSPILSPKLTIFPQLPADNLGDVLDLWPIVPLGFRVALRPDHIGPGEYLMSMALIIYQSSGHEFRRIHLQVGPHLLDEIAEGRGPIDLPRDTQHVP